VTEFTFVDELPEPTRGKPTDPILFDFADALQANPGKWAIYPNQDAMPSNSKAALASRIRCTGRIAHRSPPPPPFRGAKYEARVHEKTLYVRYLGQDGDNS